MDAIAKTSLLTAAMRAMETKRSDKEGRLFSDPYAEILAGDEGMDLLRRAIEESGDQPAIAVRTYFIDQKITEALTKGIRQIVMLAAGMDTRAFRLSFPKGTQLYELDRKEVLDYKQMKLTKAPLRCERHALAVDLREEWQGKLQGAGWKRSEPTLWMVEGLLMYLEESQVVTLFERINSLASVKDVMLFDILSRTLLEAPYMKRQLQFLENMGAPWRFGTDEPEKFMEGFHWNAVVKQTGEVSPTRWPFPVAPRNIPNVPRGFLVEAFKMCTNTTK
jgi:methyltransferase (TIGR00027 family)